MFTMSSVKMKSKCLPVMEPPMPIPTSWLVPRVSVVRFVLISIALSVVIFSVTP